MHGTVESRDTGYLETTTYTVMSESAGRRGRMDIRLFMVACPLWCAMAVCCVLWQWLWLWQWQWLKG